jgi:hypothetical protein
MERSAFVSALCLISAVSRPLAVFAADAPVVVHASSSADGDAGPFICAMQSGKPDRARNTMLCFP